MAFEVRNRSRAIIVAVVLALHLAVLVSLLLRRDPPRARPPTVEQIVVNMVAAPAVLPHTEPAPPIIIDPVELSIVSTPPPIEVAASDPAPVSWPIGKCPVLESVARVLAADRSALAAATLASRDLRTDAGAIALWNGAWVSAAEQSDGTLAPIRRALKRALATAPRACMEDAVTGPRLIPIANADRPTFLVIGSGIWHWADLRDVTDK